jgi:hypothetical protein
MQLTVVIYLNYFKYVTQYLSYSTYNLFGREIKSGERSQHFGISHHAIEKIERVAAKQSGEEVALLTARWRGLPF